MANSNVADYQNVMLKKINIYNCGNYIRLQFYHILSRPEINNDWASKYNRIVTS